MSLATNISNLATRVATEVKSVRTLVNGNASDLSALNTTTKTSLVAAVNEVNTAVSNIDVSSQVAALIDDTTTSTSKVWSSNKTNSAITSAVAAVVDAAPAALDTLNELAAALGDDANYASTITTALAGKASTTHTHAISDVTGLQTALDAKATTSALTTLSGTVSTLSTNVGDTTTNFVTTFEAGLV